MGYELDGNLLELCTCGGACYCQPQGEPDGMDCVAANAWHISHGVIGDTDVSGLTLLALQQVHGHILAGRPVMFYLDERATAEQQAALIDAFTGQLGGPLADLAQLVGEVTAIERAPIIYEIEHGQGTLRVGEAIAARLQADGADLPGRDICTTVPGSDTQIGQATSYQIDAPAYDVALALQDYPVLHGRFHFKG